MPNYEMPINARNWKDMHSGGMLAGWKYSNYKDGVFAEFFHVNDADGNLALLPKGIEPEEACMLSDMVPTGFHGVELADVQFGDEVLVVGMGHKQMIENTQKVSKKFLYLIIFSYAIQGLVENTFTSAWPSISSALNVDISLIGVATMISYVGSSTTCILADRIRKKLGTNYSSILTLAFYIMSFIIMFFARNIISVMLAVGIMGFGIGLNEINSDSYVIKAYDAKWDSFLHAFWGVGSFVAPVLLGLRQERLCQKRF